MSLKNKKTFLFIWIWLILFWLIWLSFLFSYRKETSITSNKKKNLLKKENIIQPQQKKILKIKKKKEQIVNTWIFTAKAHKAIRESKWKDYIIDFRYGVGYVNKFWNIIYWIDPKVKEERKIVEEKVIKKIQWYCQLNKFQLKDYGGLKWMKSFFDKLLTYYSWDIFLDKEKIDLTQKYIGQYCKVYNPLLKKILKKAVILSFFDFNTNKCKININWENNVNIICNNKGRNWRCKTRGRFYITFHRWDKMNSTTEHKIIKIPNEFFIR